MVHELQEYGITVDYRSYLIKQAALLISTYLHTFILVCDLNKHAGFAFKAIADNCE
jgi:hypothetical protein